MDMYLATHSTARQSPQFVLLAEPPMVVDDVPIRARLWKKKVSTVTFIYSFQRRLSAKKRKGGRGKCDACCDNVPKMYKRTLYLYFQILSKHRTIFCSHSTVTIPSDCLIEYRFQNRLDHQSWAVRSAKLITETGLTLIPEPTSSRLRPVRTKTGSPHRSTTVLPLPFLITMTPSWFDRR